MTGEKISQQMQMQIDRMQDDLFRTESEKEEQLLRVDALNHENDDLKLRV